MDFRSEADDETEKTEGFRGTLGKSIHRREVAQEDQISLDPTLD